MTRFAATTRDARLALFEEAIEAHRERASPFLTVEVDPGPEMQAAPWVQYAVSDGLVNLDCTEAEQPAVESAVETFGGATIAERTTPDTAEGTNLKVAVDGSADRVAMLIETLFREGFGRPADYRVWVIEI